MSGLNKLFSTDICMCNKTNEYKEIIRSSVCICNLDQSVTGDSIRKQSIYGSLNVADQTCACKQKPLNNPVCLCSNNKTSILID